MKQSMSHTIISSIASLAAVCVVAGVAVLIHQEWIVQYKAGQEDTAIQGCYEVSKVVTTTTGEGTSSDWQVQDVKMNQDILTSCFEKKGL